MHAGSGVAIFKHLYGKAGMRCYSGLGSQLNG